MPVLPQRDYNGAGLRGERAACTTSGWARTTEARIAHRPPSLSGKRHSAAELDRFLAAPGISALRPAYRNRDLSGRLSLGALGEVSASTQGATASE